MGDAGELTRVPVRSTFAPLPPPPVRRSWDGVLHVVLLVAVITGPLIALHRSTLSDKWLVVAAAMGFGAAAAVYVARLVLPWRRLGLAMVVVIAAGTAYAVGRLFGEQYGLWMGAGLLVAGWAIGSGSLQGWIVRAARALGHAIVVVFFVPLGLLFVVVPWLVNSVVRIDPLRAPVSRTSGWLRLERLDVRADQPWTSEPLVARLGLWYRLRSALVWPVLGLLVVLAVVASPELSKIGSPPGAGAGGVPAAYRGESWYPGYVADIQYIAAPTVASQPLELYNVADVATKTVNIRNGVRRSWHPPACDCKRLKVWLYGGSTTFGLGQRDQHTIASELAREAWKHGVALDVDNRGVLSDAQWQESWRYAWDTATYDSPDVVLFYDGFNEINATQELVNRRVGDIYPPINATTADFWRNYLEQTDPKGPAHVPPGAAVVNPPTVATDTVEQYASLLWKRYDRGRSMSDGISALHGVPTFYLWQPVRISRPQVEGEWKDNDEGYARERDRAIISQMPDDVIDLSDVLDDVRTPVFWDDVHHNEVAATIIAKAMYDQLAPDLAQIRKGRPVHVPTAP